jgi:predicted ATP-grasp superfamily ATP-dependent carboligase
MRVLDLKREDLKGSLLLVGFPGRGLVGPIVASYIGQELKMWPVAAVADSRMPPTAAVGAGRAAHPIQIYASAEACGPDGKCDKLLVLNSEIPIEPSLVNELAEAVLTWARDKGIQHIITVEGVEMEVEGKPKAKAPALRGLAGRNRELTLKDLGVEALPDGVITSHSSAFLLTASELKLDILSLLVAAGEEADERAAAEALVKIDPLLPNINLNAKTFRQKVGKLQATAKSRAKEQASQMQKMRRTYEMMYQ